MTLRHLQIYLAVYEAENITKAAQSLHMTQPAVTRAIQEIENYYGIRLFDRINRRLSITESGKSFYSSAVHIIDSFDQLEKGIRNWDKFGVIRVGTTITMGYSLLPKVLSLFQDRYPKLTVKSTIANSTQLKRMLLNNQLDFAFIEDVIDTDQLYRKYIGSDQLVLLVPPNDPRIQKESLSIKDLCNDRFLLGNNESAIRKHLDHVFAVHGITLKPVMENICTMSTIQSVHEGIGISFLPEQLARSSIASGVVATIPIHDEKFLRDHYAVWHKHKLLPRSAQEMIDCFLDLAKEDFLWLPR